ncbi:MAG: Ig-like domain-containing protein, partial [Woeseia sp.]
GEIRGQIVPPDAGDFDAEAPVVDLASPGATISGTVTLEATASDNLSVVAVRFLANGVNIGSDAAAPYAVDWDTTTVADGDFTLTAEAEDGAGNVGVSAGVDVTVQNGAAVTLTQIQNQVFTPICSGCHTGPTSNTLPSGMNLSTTADSFAALVDVPSIQVPSIDRVEPGEPDNSYLIHKLEGTQSVGDRMPQGGPFLDQDTIDMIRTWITDGAPNN